MADMLSSGISGLQAFQRALDTTSHNIANANTDGYSRQSVVLGTRGATPLGEGWIGNGVDVVAIRRSYDSLLGTQVRNATSSFQNLDTQATLAESLTNTLSDSTTGLSTAMQNFSSALQTLSNSPADSAARQSVLSGASTLVTRLKSYDSSLDELSNRVESGLSDEVTEVNSLTSGIAELNKRIIAARAQSSGAANDLLDQRDQLVTELSTHLNVSTVVADDGSVNVYTGAGQALVMGGNTYQLVTTQDPANSSEQRIGIQTSNYVSDITSSVSGGTIGGLLQFRSETLDPARQALGQVAVGIGTQLNQLQSQGYDLNGNIGSDLFTIGGVQARSWLSNGGGATIAATREDVASLGAGSYTLSYDGSAWSLKDDVTGNSVALGGSGTSADPLTGGGLSLVVSGTAQAGDSYTIDPWGGAIDGMSVAISDPGEVAAAALTVTSAASTNTGTGTISAGTVADTSAWVPDDYTLSFTDASNWQVEDSSGNVVANGAYTAGAAIDFNGIQVSISGTPAAGDSFSIGDNANGSGDNRNAQAMVDVFDSKYLNGGKTSVNGAIDSLTTKLATQASQLNTARDAQQSALDDATSAVQSVSGVNLDEEAANLLQYQQAYQAAAQVISIANTLFDSVLQAVRS